MANVITVTALNRYVKTLLETDPVLTDVAVRGEVQNFVHHLKSGHFYFSLKDETGSVKAVMFRSNASRLAFRPENGMSVIVRGRISLYERDGAFQIYVDELFLDGVGAAQKAFEQLKARLESEGLFDTLHKKPLPAMPRRIGLVTSKTGAAIRDIYAVAQRRWPLADFLLYDASVQGQEAEHTLVEGVRQLDESGLVDVIIVARGGGSREDLWVFNSEALARAAYACKTPLVSGVGHEIDFSILDFVADVRAATPTAAAELVLPDIAAVRAHLAQAQNISKLAVSHKYKVCYNRLNVLLCTQALRNPARQNVAAMAAVADRTRRLQAAMEQKLAGVRQQLAARAGVVESLSPLATLSRGYCIASTPEGIVKKQNQLVPGEGVRLDFTDFSADCTVLQTTARKDLTHGKG